jgi:hypothetical protein
MYKSAQVPEQVSRSDEDDDYQNAHKFPPEPSVVNASSVRICDMSMTPSAPARPSLHNATPAVHKAIPAASVVSCQLLVCDCRNFQLTNAVFGTSWRRCADL